MKTIYIVYAHQYRDPYMGVGLELLTIGVARDQKEIDTIINNFRKEQQRGDYWMGFHTDADKNIECSTKKIKNIYLK
jgi:hypothetical protein